MTMKQNANVYTENTYMSYVFYRNIVDDIDITHMSKTRHTLPKVMTKDMQTGKQTVSLRYLL